jgi:hypothetical protein
VAETRFRDSSGPPVRNRSPGGWGWGGRKSRARPSYPVWIRYTRYGVRIRVKFYTALFQMDFRRFKLYTVIFHVVCYAVLDFSSPLPQRTLCPPSLAPTVIEQSQFLYFVIG